jgi:hypothetical protein
MLLLSFQSLIAQLVLQFSPLVDTMDRIRFASQRPAVDVEKAEVRVTSMESPAPGISSIPYGARLSGLFFPNWNPRQHDKVLTFQRLRRYDIVRIQHDILKLQDVLRNPDGGTDEDRRSLTALLHDHGTPLHLKPHSTTS